MTMRALDLNIIICFSIVAICVFTGWVYQRRRKFNYSLMLPIIVALFIFVTGIFFQAYDWSYDSRSDCNIHEPLGIIEYNKTATSVTILICTTPDGAMVEGTLFALSHEEIPQPISKANLYYFNETLAASYDSDTEWSYMYDATMYDLEFSAGMTIEIIASSISAGDSIVIASSEDYYGTTTLKVV